MNLEFLPDARQEFLAAALYPFAHRDEGVAARRFLSTAYR
jgi:hypothetical protein